MQKQKHVSFLDKKVNHKEKMWCPITSAIYENDTIELKFACHYISQEERIIKSINLELGEKTLYKIKGGIPKGKVSLNFTTMTLKDQDSQYIFHLQKNNKILDILVQNVEQIKQVLGKKCILNTFHEDYQIDKIIQNGNKNQGYFVAIKKSTKEKYAIKAYSKEALKQQELRRESLKNEIKAIRMMNQERIINLHEVHETQNSIYLIMDLISGGQLNERMSDIIFSEKDIKLLMYNLLKTLNYLHLKKCSAEVQFDWKISQQKQCGTKYYFAPEAQNASDDMIPGKSDIYSAGVIFYKLVSGDSVFNQSDFFNFQQQIQKKDVDFFYKFKEGIVKSDLKMLRVNPNIRQSALKCLTHRYFKSIFNPEDLLSDLKQKIQRIDSQIQKGQISINAHNQEPNQQQESPNSIQSPTNGQVNEGLIQRVTKYSKFHQFCEQMKYSKTHSNSQKSEVSLLKLQNSKNQGSKDDIFLNPIITASKGIKRSSLKL